MARTTTFCDNCRIFGWRFKQQYGRRCQTTPSLLCLYPVCCKLGVLFLIPGTAMILGTSVIPNNDARCSFFAQSLEGTLQLGTISYALHYTLPQGYTALHVWLYATRTTFETRCAPCIIGFSPYKKLRLSLIFSFLRAGLYCLSTSQHMRENCYGCKGNSSGGGEASTFVAPSKAIRFRRTYYSIQTV